jgi:adenylate kinase family enzyme
VGARLARRSCAVNRIVIVGTTGSGKTTLGESLACKSGRPHVDLDALNWGPDWNMVDRDVFRKSVASALRGDCWITSGNYSAVRDIVWKRADTLIWLDYPLRVTLWRLLRRTLKRIITQEELWHGNRETFRAQFLSRDSLILWAVKSHLRRRNSYPAALAQPEYSHLSVLRFTHPAQTERWLATIKRSDSEATPD